VDDATRAAAAPLLQVTDLKTRFFTSEGVIPAVDGVTFSIRRGETLGVVGESGCGKSVTALSVMRLIAPPGRIVEGSIELAGIDVLAVPERDLGSIRGSRVAMIFQEPMTSLNPVFTIGDQIGEALKLRGTLSGAAARQRCIQLLELVKIAGARERLDAYPHQLSGGMKQRVMIAMALASAPDLLIADESTTALDVTIQAQILELLRELRTRLGLAMMMITHDLGVIAEMADRVVVMYVGKIVEEASVAELFDAPKHPYTQALLASVPTMTSRRDARLAPIEGSVPSLVRPLPPGCRFAPRCPHAFDRCRVEDPPLIPVGPGHAVRCWLHDPATVAPSESARIAATASTVADRPAPAPFGEVILSIKDLVKHYPIRGGLLSRVVAQVRAVDHVSFEVRAGETFGVVGESGCGKTTTGRAILRLVAPTSGEVRFQGKDLLALGARALNAARRDLQLIFQDPFGALDPRFTVGQIITEGLRIHGIGNAAERDEKLRDIMKKVGLHPDYARRYPHEFSGGQRQRIGIARALILRPKLVVADEPVSALDVSIQSQVLNLLNDLKRDFQLTYVVIAHNLAVVRFISDRTGVMYLGKLVEVAVSTEISANPLHPYTQALVAAIPVAHPRLRRARPTLVGDIPSPIDPPSGCRFHPRCPIARADPCNREEPPLREVGSGHLAACHAIGAWA
jgi:peptide/nickel transport system ATP-binding protein